MPTPRYAERVVPFTAGDGLECNLINIRGDRPPSKGPILLVHGAGVRANIFRAPVETTIVDALLADGYDVWLENWRASIDLPRNPWTLDQAALYDHPQAVRKVVEETGSSELKALVHCQGSTSFLMSVLAGLVPEVKTVVSNAVSLHTVTPRLSRLKAHAVLPAITRLSAYVDPAWGNHAPALFPKAMTLFVRLTDHQCDNTVCKMVSFIYGAGPAALWRHENLNDRTHEWVRREFGPVPLTFFTQMARCVEVGHLVSVDGDSKLPRDFVAQAPATDARFAFFAGADNRCFLAESQRRTFEFMESWRPNYHRLFVIPGYRHLDMFMGKTAARDVFPLMLQELDR